MTHEIVNIDVAHTFQQLDAPMYQTLMDVRNLIFKVADMKEIELEESLKWGQPSYKAKKGTPIRVGVFNEDKSKAALYVNCSTTLVSEYKPMLDNVLHFSGNRAIVLAVGTPLPEKELAIIIAAALTYHQ